MSYMLQPQIILLKEGTDTSQGKAQLVSNINACMVRVCLLCVCVCVCVSWGPAGLRHGWVGG